jgi:hypothetical protein
MITRSVIPIFALLLMSGGGASYQLYPDFNADGVLSFDEAVEVQEILL